MLDQLTERLTPLIQRSIGPAKRSPAGDWLQSNGYEKYIDAFTKEDISLDLFPSLSEEELRKEFSMTIGEAKRFCMLIQKTKCACGQILEKDQKFCQSCGVSFNKACS